MVQEYVEMKPDAFIPLYGNNFFAAVEGQDDRMIVAYMRIIWHYWHHNHCAGIKDDERHLRGLCRMRDIPDEDWQHYRDLIFDNNEFMTQDANGLWHQKFASEKWQEAVAGYQRVVNGGKNRWKGVSKAERSQAARNAAKARYAS